MTHSEAKDLFTYANGNLFWTKTGKVAGSLKRNGYKLVKHKGVFTGAHRIIFFLRHGFFPEMVDHIDGNVSNNSIENLRAATRSQNGMNSRRYSSNTSGYRNVYKDKHSFTVRLKVNGKLKSLGNYEDIELAGLVAEEARAKFHGQFAHQSLRARVAQLESKP